MSKGAKMKGYIKHRNSGKTMTFMFNPETLSERSSVTFNEISAPGSSYPRTQYVKGESTSIPLELFLFDTKGGVESFITFIKTFLPMRNNKFDKPSVAIFALGSYVRECVIESIDIQRKRWDTNLVCIEATINLSFKEV